MNSKSGKILILAVAFLTVFFTACSSGPAGPEKGTPAFYWAAANETFGTGDYLKTRDHLEQICKIDNEYTARAHPWLLVLTAGMAKGMLDLADSFELGSRVNKANPTPFRRKMSDYQTMANRLSLELAETFARFQGSNKDEQIPLAFRYPTGSPAPVLQLSKVGGGVMIADAEIEAAQKRALERSVLMTTCRAAGAPEDAAKTAELFKRGNVQVPRATFVLAMAQGLYDQSQLYLPHKLGQPDRLKVLCQRASEAIKPLPDSKEKKELEKKIQDAIKKVAS